MEKVERDQILQYLTQSREMLARAVDGLSSEQRSFRAAPHSWSVADCVEHLAVVEHGTLKNIQRLLEQPPSEQPDTSGKDQVILSRVPGRAARVKAPEAAIPKGRWPDFDELMRQFQTTRDRTITFAAETQADLRAYSFPHPFLGPLDCYQWLMFTAAHCERHVRQMEEVKADPAFPGRVGSAIA